MQRVVLNSGIGVMCRGVRGQASSALPTLEMHMGFCSVASCFSLVCFAVGTSALHSFLAAEPEGRFPTLPFLMTVMFCLFLPPEEVRLIS